MKCKYCDNEVLRGYRVCSCCKPYSRWVRTLEHAGFLGKTESLEKDLQSLSSVCREKYSVGEDPRTIGQEYHIDGMRVREILKLSGSLRTRSESALRSEKIKNRSKNTKYLTRTRWIHYCSEVLELPESDVLAYLQEFMESHSYLELWTTYKIPGHVLQKLGITTRSRAEATTQGYLSGKLKQGCKKFQTGFHISWEGIEFYYRSSYERDFMEELDSLQVPYRVETLSIPYFDTQQNRERIAIPDFYLPQTNEIVEIKSSFTYDEQNMKDRAKAYKTQGYGFRLILNHKNVPVDQLEESIA